MELVGYHPSMVFMKVTLTDSHEESAAKHLSCCYCCQTFYNQMENHLAELPGPWLSEGWNWDV